ncbi:trypsin-like serine peptidase [Psychromicrobium lacuslunae]|nr:serine protease [Psychromicrobium lacuslunae]
MKTLARSTATLGATLAVFAGAMLSGQTASATPVENLPIQPVGYTVVNGVPDKAHPITKAGITGDVGYNVTAASTGTLPVAESVIGPDGRTKVTNTTASPYRRTGQITFKEGGSSYICTGWLISASTVVTAGHCLNGGDSTNITFTPARNGATDPYGTFTATEVWVDSRGVDADGGDWGVIQLNKPVGSQLGWYGIQAAAPSSLSGKTAHIIGYPGDKPSGTMWQHTDTINSATGRNFYYQTDTAGGQSGSAVTTTNNDVSNGIHVWGNGGSGNGATRITAELFNTLAKLRK